MTLRRALALFGVYTGRGLPAMDDVLVGKIVRPQGVHGELKVYPLTRDPQRFRNLREVTLVREGIRQRVNIRSAKVSPDFVYLTVDGIDTRDAADSYRGWEVRVDRSEVPPLAEGWYYFELEGMQVYEEDKLLGTLTQVLETGANDVYLVRGEKGEICIPALKTVVLHVDMPGRRMDVSLPPGLVEER